MTKSKKLISMLLAFVMLVTSCSLSFFAFAAESDVDEANNLAEVALAGMNAGTVQAADTAFITKLNSLSSNERLQVNPVYYTYAIHVATTYVVRQNNGNKTPALADRCSYLMQLGNWNNTIAAQYDAFLKIPDEYIEVIGDLNKLNTRTVVDTDTYLTSTTTYYQLITAALTNVSFDTNETAKILYENFWAAYKFYSEAQLLFADALIMASYNTTNKATGGVTGLYNGTAAGNAVKSSDYDSNLNYFFGARSAERFALLHYMYKVHPLNANVVKAKYISGSAWADANGPAQYYAELKDFYTNANARTVTFFDDYFTELSDASDAFSGLEDIDEILNVGLALNAGYRSSR